MKSIEISSPEAMADLGSELGAALRVGDLVLLQGELAAGKTALVCGIGRAMQVEEQVASPTFVIARRHRGVIPLTHVDLYRLLDHRHLSHQISDLDLESDLAVGVVVVEWGEEPLFGGVALVIAIEITSPEERLVTIDWRR